MATSKPETKITQAVIKRIKELGGHARKVHGNQYQSGEPDVDACLGGSSIKIEIKVPGKEPTAQQMARLRTWQAAGAHADWVTSVEELDESLGHLGDPEWRSERVV